MKKKYRNIVETANEGIGVIDSEFKLTYVNKKIEDMIGYSSGEIIGKSMWISSVKNLNLKMKMILIKGVTGF